LVAIWAEHHQQGPGGKARSSRRIGCWASSNGKVSLELPFLCRQCNADSFPTIVCRSCPPNFRPQSAPFRVPTRLRRSRDASRDQEELHLDLASSSFSREPVVARQNDRLIGCKFENKMISSSSNERKGATLQPGSNRTLESHLRHEFERRQAITHATISPLPVNEQFLDL
jgi:hypothetical protein